MHRRTARFPASSRPPDGAWLSPPPRLRSRNRRAGRRDGRARKPHHAFDGHARPLSRARLRTLLTAMPDDKQATTSFEPRHLPVLVTPTRENGEGWFSRVLRVLFGWKPSTIRADLSDVLDLLPPGE